MLKLRKGILLTGLLAFMLTAGFMFACGGGTSGETETKYDIVFANTELPSIKLEEGDLLQKPSNIPADKNKTQFDDWYLDSTFNNKATFPITVDSNITLYAKFIPYKEYFLNARENTLGDETLGFEYNYTLNLSITAPVVGTVEGNQNGTSKYSKSGEIGFLDHHTNSGLLFNDGEIYEYKKGSNNNRVELDENGKVIGFSTSIDTNTQKYNSSSFAKALFDYSDADITSIDRNGGEYAVKTKTNVSDVVNLILNYIDHPMVERILKLNMPNIQSDLSIKADCVDHNLSEYEYSFSVTALNVKVEITYKMDFTKTNQAPQMSLPNIGNLKVDSASVNSDLQKINAAIDAYKDQSVSSGSFKLRTGVDYGLANLAINATVAGDGKRNDSGDFINLIEIDSDFKNDDLYASLELKDVKFARGNTSDGAIYDRVKQLIGYDDPVAVSGTQRGNLDIYYLLLDSTFLNSTNVNSTSVTANNNVSKYSLTLSQSGVKNLFDYINETVQLNPFVANSIKVLGDYDDNDIQSKKIDFVIEIDNVTNTLVSINLDLTVKSNVAFVGSRDFGASDRATVNVNLNYQVTDDADSYSAPDSADDLEY